MLLWLVSKKVNPALIALNKLNACIKIQKLLIPQQRKNFFTLSHKGVLGRYEGEAHGGEDYVIPPNDKWV